MYHKTNLLDSQQKWLLLLQLQSSAKPYTLSTLEMSMAKPHLEPVGF